MFPYLIGWTLYQGSMLMSVLNWTGLVVNGFVAFLLPMYLVIKSMERRHLDVLVATEGDAHEDRTLLEMAHTHSHASHASHTAHTSERAAPLSVQSTGTSLTTPDSIEMQEGSRLSPYHTFPENFTSNRRTESASSPLPVHPIHDDSCVEPLPLWLEPFRYPIVLFMIVCFATIILGTIFLDVYMGVQPA